MQKLITHIQWLSSMMQIYLLLDDGIVNCRDFPKNMFKNAYYTIAYFNGLTPFLPFVAAIRASSRAS